MPSTSFLAHLLVLLSLLHFISSIENPILIDKELKAPKTLSHCNFYGDMYPGPNENYRKFTFSSNCSKDLYVNMEGYTWYGNMAPQYQSLPEGGGFKLSAYTSKSYQVSERVYSGRIWARINCETRSGTLLGSAGKFICDTSNCPLPYGTGIAGTNPDVTCTIYTQSGQGIFVGGVPPGPLAEFTLCGGMGANAQCYSGGSNCNGPDYYDLSLVDGPSSLTISMTQIGGQAAGSDPAYSCGNPETKKIDYKTCPLELRVGLKYDSQTTIWSYYNKAALADTLGCISGCTYIANYYPNTDPNYNTLYATTCCTCGNGGGTCEQYCGGDGCQDNEYNPACIAGCSPNNLGYPNTTGWRNTECFLNEMPSINTGRSCSAASDCYDGPSSLNPYSCTNKVCYLNLGQVPNIFKTNSPEAYSWQFDDLSSTYLCYYPGYLVEFGC